jgi:hypothetical protein
MLARERTVSRIMDKLTRSMDTSLLNARKGAKNLQIAKYLDHLEQHKRLSIMRALETSFQHIKESRVFKRFLDPFPEADLHKIVLHALPSLMHDYNGGMGKKSLAAVHRKLRLSDEVYSYFVENALTVMRMEGMKEEFLQVMLQRMEHLRHVIVSPTPIMPDSSIAYK